MAKKPHVIIFLTDQQRWDSTGLAGNPEGLTPHLDHAARRGAFFDVPITPQPLCTPARSCLQTGRFATSTGVHRNGIPLGEEPDALARIYAAAGYQTGYIGKWHLGDVESAGPVRRDQRAGYDHWLAANLLELTSDAYSTTLWDDSGEAVDLPGYRVDAVADAAIRFIDAHADDEQPFFLFVSFLEPHHQNSRDDYPPPEAYSGRYQGAWLPPDLASLGGTAHRQIDGYYGMIKRLDEAYGRMTDALRSLEIAEDTVVAFTSDHGNHFKTRNSEYKRSVHDASVRVPLVLTGPGVPQGRYVQEVVSTLDLLPTLLELSEVPVPGSYQGRSLVELMRHCESDWSDEAFIQVSESEVARAVRTRRWKYGVRARDAHPVEDPGSDVYEEAYFYDLQADPHELRNLFDAASHRGVREVLEEKLLAWMAHAQEPLPRILAAEPSAKPSNLTLSDGDQFA